MPYLEGLERIIGVTLLQVIDNGGELSYQPLPFLEVPDEILLKVMMEMSRVVQNMGSRPDYELKGEYLVPNGSLNTQLTLIITSQQRAEELLES